MTTLQSDDAAQSPAQTITEQAQPSTGKTAQPASAEAEEEEEEGEGDEEQEEEDDE